MAHDKEFGHPDFTPDTSEQPAGIYVHIPFCKTKCPYCCFVSTAGHDLNLMARYMKALGKQAKKMAGHPWVAEREFRSVFVGGGTPTSVEPEKLAAVIATCLAGYNFSN